MACAKINSAHSAPRAHSSDSPLDKASVTSDIHLSKEIGQRDTGVQEVVFLVTDLQRSSASEYPVMFFNCLLRSLGFIAGIVK